MDQIVEWLSSNPGLWIAGLTLAVSLWLNVRGWWRGWRDRRRLRLGWRFEQDPSHVDVFVWVTKFGVLTSYLDAAGFAWLGSGRSGTTNVLTGDGWTPTDDSGTRMTRRRPRLWRTVRRLAHQPDEQWAMLRFHDQLPAELAADGERREWKRCADQLIGAIRYMGRAPTHVYVKDPSMRTIETTPELRRHLLMMAREPGRNPRTVPACPGTRWHMEAAAQKDIAKEDTFENQLPQSTASRERGI